MSKWYNEAIFYHIYPLGLVGAPKVNQQEIVEHKFEELEKWILHLQELSIGAVYIGPLFESTTHGYDTKDYKVVDKRLGDNEDFKKYVEICHKAGIKVVVDGVFNHTGREFFAFKDLKENGQSSKYKDWYKDVNFGGTTPYGDAFSYAEWRGCYELVNLNLYNTEVTNYLFDVIKYWISEFDIDGIRLDCADCLTFEFMKEMRNVTQHEKKDFWLMGEVIHGDYGRWVNQEMLHSVTDYELHKGLYSGHNDHNYFEIAHTVRRLFDENGGICKDAVLYSFVDNHDVDRVASKVNNMAYLIPIYALLYTLPGIPSLYYGSEWGIEGKKTGNSDDVLRPAISIDDEGVTQKNLELTKYICELGKMKKENSEIFCGKYKELLLSNRQYVFARFTKERGIVTIVNNDDNDITVMVPLNLPFEIKSAMNAFTNDLIVVENGQIQIVIEANSAIMIKINEIN
ncbi:MAG: alpha-amylase family glycosyl hydrolase [Lachnotalea sp.]